MARRSWVRKLRNKPSFVDSWLRSVTSGNMFNNSSVRGNSVQHDIKTQIEMMRTLARDSQISTALSYYATDSTVPNSAGQIIWATVDSDAPEDLQSVLDDLFDRWHIDSYVRDHILELATVGNLYLPTTSWYNPIVSKSTQRLVALDNNTIPDPNYDIIPSTKIPPDDILHLYKMGQPCGYIYSSEDTVTDIIQFPESAVIHFSLGGLLGDYKITLRNSSGEDEEYDIKFAQPMLEQAVQPTQALNLLENAVLLNSLIQTVRFINVDCSNAEEEEISAILVQIKSVIEQALSINTNTGDTESYVNPQSPNNLVYLPKVNGQDAVSITDLDMRDTSDSNSKLLDYYQNKKLSVLGVPKEQLNFSSNEGLGGAGSVLSQRSAIYANGLQRLTSAYMEGWAIGLNNYFLMRGFSKFVNKFQLHMSPIVTPLSTINFDRRDSALQQADNLIRLMGTLGVTDASKYKDALIEILTEVFPKISSDIQTWNVEVKNAEEGL